MTDADIFLDDHLGIDEVLEGLNRTSITVELIRGQHIWVFPDGSKVIIRVSYSDS